MTRLVALSLWFLLACLLPLPAAAQETPPARLSPEVVPTHYWLDLAVSPAAERFSGEARIAVSLPEATALIWMHGRGLAVAEAFVLAADGARVEASFAEFEESGFAAFRTARAVGPGAVTLVLRYDAPFDQSLEGLYQVRFGGEAYAYTQFEATSARLAFPAFDEPGFKTPFDIALTVGGADIAVSNGPQQEVQALADGRRRVVFATTAPLPTYLVALAVGPFDVVEWPAIPPNAVRSRPLPLRGIAPKGEGALFAYALEHTAPLLAVLEDYFGSPYPFAKLDLVAVASFGPSGMENAGAIFYRRDRVLLGATPSLFERRGYVFLHAHELAHSWFGNLVTPRWWDDLWLNEAFATWMAERAAHLWQPAVFDDRGAIRTARDAMWDDRLAGARMIRQPILSQQDISSAFDGITCSRVPPCWR